MNHDDRHCGRIQADPRGESWDDEVRAHAAGCAACVAYLEGVGALGQRLRSLPSLIAPMSSALRESLLAQLAACASAPADAEAAPRLKLVSSRRLRRFAMPVALAATLATGVLLGNGGDFGFPRPPAEVSRNIGMYIHDVTHDHYLIERIGRPLEVTLTDRDALSSWLSESLSFPIQLPATGSAFSLQGGRVWHTVGRLSALAAYRTEDGGRVILFAVPAHNLDLQGAESVMVGRTRVFTGKGWEREAQVWIDGDLAMALVAMEGKLSADWAETFLP